MNIYDEDPETGAPRDYSSQPTGRDVEPPHGQFTVAGEADLQSIFPRMDRETAQRLVSAADDGYAPGSPDTLGEFVMDVRNPFTRALEASAAYKITRRDDSLYEVTETSREEIGE